MIIDKNKEIIKTIQNIKAVEVGVFYLTNDLLLCFDFNNNYYNLIDNNGQFLKEYKGWQDMIQHINYNIYLKCLYFEDIYINRFKYVIEKLELL